MRSGPKLALGSTSENLSLTFLPAKIFSRWRVWLFPKAIGETQHRNSLKFRYPKKLTES